MVKDNKDTNILRQHIKEITKKAVNKWGCVETVAKVIGMKQHIIKIWLNEGVVRERNKRHFNMLEKLVLNT